MTIAFYLKVNSEYSIYLSLADIFLGLLFLNLLIEKILARSSKAMSILWVFPTREEYLG